MVTDKAGRSVRGEMTMSWAMGFVVEERKCGYILDLILMQRKQYVCGRIAYELGEKEKS